jgi:tetraacyldisaccharide 4'-kinase
LTAGVLFVTNGHGEAAIAERIARDVRALAPLTTDHLALVGERFGNDAFPDVGPQRAMPSGGLVAMGNVRAFARDLGAGWLGLFASQLRFLRGLRGRYAAVVAVGDAYAAALTRLAGLPWAFVGTAKSEYVAPYDAVERRIIEPAARIFVRDAATADALRRRGLRAEAPGNVIVDLLTTERRYVWPGPVRIAILPGSRERAYADAGIIADVVARVAAQVPGVASVLSIAPGLDATRFAPLFEAYPALGVWFEGIGGILDGATLAIGQAGTANEAAAANGVPVAALELDGDRRSGWYRMRQERLLAEAMLVVPGEPAAAAAAIVALLNDPARLTRMGMAGRERMGAAGGAAAIARAVADLAQRAGTPA